jgi:hypothetical protein
MSLIEQFPDISMLIRDKKRLDLKYNAAKLFKDIQYKPIISDQEFHDKEFRTWHIKLLLCVGITITIVFYVALNAKSILSWMTS